jgi:hypothetical protein
VPAFATADLLFVHLANLTGGNSVPVDKSVGASAIHSVEAAGQVAAAQRKLRVKLLPGVVESVTFTVYLAPMRTTDTVILSPALTEVPTSWIALTGNSSHQVS